MQAKGFFRTNYENNIVKIAENSWYLTGIVDSITDASLKIPETESGKERLFIANVDDNAKILSFVITSYSIHYTKLYEICTEFIT